MTAHLRPVRCGASDRSHLVWTPISMIVLVQFLLSCASPHDLAISPHPVVMADRHADDYAVYGDFLEHANRALLPLSGGVHHVFAVADTLSRMPWQSFSDEGSGDLLAETFARMYHPADLTESFYAANEAQLCLDPHRFRSRHPVVLIAGGSAACAEAGGEPRELSGDLLVTGFSRVGFSDDRRQALMVVEAACGPRCGWISAVHMELVEGRWTVLYSRQVIVF
jgi:hypothetical protein